MFAHPENACSWLSFASLRLSTQRVFLCQRYNDAMATIRRIPSIEHNFQLVITRVYEDGDQELLEDEEESAFFCYPFISRPSLFHKPTKNAYSSLVRNSSSVQARVMANRPFSGATFKATLMNSMNLLPPGRTRLQRFSLRHACTAPCMSASTSQVQTIYRTKIWPNLCGSTFFPSSI
jgi:hypothetical protein